MARTRVGVGDAPQRVVEAVLVGGGRERLAVDVVGAVPTVRWRATGPRSGRGWHGSRAAARGGRSWPSATCARAASRRPPALSSPSAPITPVVRCGSPSSPVKSIRYTENVGSSSVASTPSARHCAERGSGAVVVVGEDEPDRVVRVAGQQCGTRLRFDHVVGWSAHRADVGRRGNGFRGREEIRARSRFSRGTVTGVSHTATPGSFAGGRRHGVGIRRVPGGQSPARVAEPPRRGDRARARP